MNDPGRPGEQQSFRFLLAVDAEGYTNHTVLERAQLVRTLHEITFAALRDAGIEYEPEGFLNRGDGFIIIFPEGFNRYVNLIDPFLRLVEGGLDEYNRQQAAPRMRLRLRVAMNYGNVISAGDTPVGAVDEISRLLDCGPLRRTLERAQDAHLAVLVSGFVYNNAVRPRFRRIDPDVFHRAEIDVKGKAIGPLVAWLHLPEVPDPGDEFWESVIADPVPEPELIPEPTPDPVPAHVRLARAVLSALRTAATSVRVGLRWVLGGFRRHWPPPRWALIGGAVVLVAAALLAGYLVVYAPSHGTCPAPTALNVLTSTSSERAVRDAAMTYQRTRRDHGCVRVDMTVYAVPDGAAHEALVNGWHTPTELDLGPPPNVWMPDTSADRAMLDAHRLAGSGLRLGALGSTRASPYVVGLPAAATAKVDVPRVGASWRSLDQALRTAHVPYARPSTITSTTALAQTSGIWQDLKPGSAGAPDERAVEHQLSGGALTSPDEAGLLCAMRQNGEPPRSAVLVTERALAAYNAGRPLNDQCGWQDRPPGDDRRLTPYYPGAVRTADYPMYEVTYGSSDTRAQHREVQAFFGWLRGAGRAGLAADGYRDTHDQVRTVLAGGDAGEIEAGLAAARPTPALTGFAARLATLRRNVRVLVAVDLSGTMNDPTTRGTRFDASRDAMREAGSLISPGDSIELWGFPAYGKTYGHQSVVSTGDTSAYLRGVDKMRPNAPATPLYQTIQDGVRELADADGKERLGLLVISDGLDDSSGRGQVSAAALRKTLRTDGAGVSVLLVDPVRGGCAKASATGVRCAELDGPGDPVYSFFTGLWGG